MYNIDVVGGCSTFSWASGSLGSARAHGLRLLCARARSCTLGASGTPLLLRAAQDLVRHMGCTVASVRGVDGAAIARRTADGALLKCDARAGATACCREPHRLEHTALIARHLRVCAHDERPIAGRDRGVAARQVVGRGRRAAAGQARVRTRSPVQLRGERGARMRHRVAPPGGPHVVFPVQMPPSGQAVQVPFRAGLGQNPARAARAGRGRGDRVSQGGRRGARLRIYIYIIIIATWTADEVRSITRRAAALARPQPRDAACHRTQRERARARATARHGAQEPSAAPPCGPAWGPATRSTGTGPLMMLALPSR